jgi:hypothetical protein
MRLAVKAKGLGRRILDELETLVTPACSQSKSRGSNTRPIRNAVSGRRGFYLRSRNVVSCLRRNNLRDQSYMSIDDVPRRDQ